MDTHYASNAQNNGIEQMLLKLKPTPVFITLEWTVLVPGVPSWALQPSSL